MGTGAAHSACLDESGAVLAWRSADPGLHVQEVGAPLAGKRVVSISAGDALHPPKFASELCAPRGQVCGVHISRLRLASS